MKNNNIQRNKMNRYKKGDRIIRFNTRDDEAGILEPFYETLYYLCPTELIAPENFNYNREIISVYDYLQFKNKTIDEIKECFEHYSKENLLIYIKSEELIRPYSKRIEERCKKQIEFLINHAHTYARWKKTTLCFDKNARLYTSKHFDNIQYYKPFIRTKYFLSFLNAKIWYYYHFRFIALFKLLFLDLLNLFNKYEVYTTSQIKYQHFLEIKNSNSDNERMIQLLNCQYGDLVKSLPDIENEYHTINRNVLSTSITILSVFVAILAIYFSNNKHKEEIDDLNKVITSIQEKNNEMSKTIVTLDEKIKSIETIIQRKK